MHELDNGFININKPIGPTSHDIVDMLRKKTGIRKIGHAGTLDPFASGVLLLAIGREATKRIAELVKQDKRYQATLELGVETDTYDREGKATAHYTVPKYSQDRIEEVLSAFIGKQKQLPPIYSAKKVGGKKLYEYARSGKEVKVSANEIEIYSMVLVDYNNKKIVIDVHCSSGTYIRALAFDIGRVLGCGAHLSALTRTAIGSYVLKDSIELEEIKIENWKSFLFDI